MSRNFAFSLAFATTLFAVGCSPSNGGADQGAADLSAEATGASSTATPTPPLPDSFVETAWQTEGTDGSTYVTYLDANGRYRDLQDGQPWHQGSWDRRTDGAICFLPDGANAQRRCWQTDSMADQDHMVVVGGEEGTKVELTREDYVPPQSKKGS